MRQNVKKILIAVLVVMVLGFPTVQAEETDMLLRWKSGGSLPGQLQESNSGTIRWASPYFLDDPVVDINVLNSVVFPKTSNPATETFRVSTLSDDVWIADLIGSDENTFLFSSKRHGQFRVKRSAVHTLEHRNHFIPLFDGSRLTHWKSKSLTPKKDIDDPMLLVFRQPASNWHRDNEGRPQTHQNKAELFHTLKWPKQFEINLELAFTEHPPSFVFAFGKNLYQALRLEVWSDKLVAVQGTLFEPVLTIQPEQHTLHLRLTYDESAGVLRVFDSTGNLLLRLADIKPTVQESGPYIQNQGKGLTVQALKVYHQPVSERTAQQVDFSKSHVYLMDGKVVQGELFVQKDSTYVLDTDGTRHDIDLQKVNRVVQPELLSTALDVGTGFPGFPYIKYPDEVVLHGEITQVNSDSVMLQTAFADEPVTCSIAGALRLHFDTNSETNETVQNTDMLFHATGNLRGRVLFSENSGILSIQWEPLGALKPVRLANNRSAHIRQFLQPTSKGSRHFDTAQYPHAVHLQTGETFPCQITDYDGKSISFQSPFISAQHLDSAAMKALEFSDRTSVESIDRAPTTPPSYSVRISLKEMENGIRERKVKIFEVSKDGKRKEIKGDFDLIRLEDGGMVILRDPNPKEPRKAQDWIELTTALQGSNTHKLDAELQRALTVPRFNRDNPPNHLLVANTDDMMRGKFLGFNGQTLQFDSKLRRFSIPIHRVARVVDVSGDSSQPTPTQTEVRVRLTDGSILIFEPLEVQNDSVIGRSSIYGEVSLPISSIEYLYFWREGEGVQGCL